MFRPTGFTVLVTDSRSRCATPSRARQTIKLFSVTLRTRPRSRGLERRVMGARALRIRGGSYCRAFSALASHLALNRGDGLSPPRLWLCAYKLARGCIGMNLGRLLQRYCDTPQVEFHHYSSTLSSMAPHQYFQLLMRLIIGPVDLPDFSDSSEALRRPWQ
ncbi:hypothetical protein EXIGLDRAFT_518820 [Exidia glandulosa HHB12029]|uniref:Uncharacterized protein n=1 Tax=Exidia glandulosa HHB12029 TaxID=1314781 RepID=A0A165J6Z6_EXIGL|nr:hypothetical protein EXIGLDRAFT_518820 [Exidia glandulosa HHB12029]